MQNFYIKQGATLPNLRLELIKDGRYDFLKSYQFNNAIQNADVTFTMVNAANDILKISKEPATIVLDEDGDCEERYIIEYQWKQRDTKEKGQYVGTFEINFRDGLVEHCYDYPSGRLITPIIEELHIFVI